jgi:hypothetical protein
MHRLAVAGRLDAADVDDAPPKSLKMSALTVVFAWSLLLADGKPGW